MRKRNIIIVAIILMAVGFATLTTNLIINGNTTVSNNKEDYDIRFTKTILEGNENNSLIGNNGKEITYETSTLTNVGDKSELVYEISNNSSQYDAEVSINCVPTSTITHTSYYTINTTNTPGTIKAKRSARGSIIVTLTKLSTENFKENFKCTLTINAVERTSIGKPIYKEEILNGTDPVVKEGLIPVTLSSDGTVTMADTSEEWYNYEKKNWANAVILNDTASKEYKVGEVIEESDIESYFVWIPKYKYKLWNVNSTESNIGKHSIDIIFDSKDTTDIEGESCATPMISGESGNCNNGEYMTHPAFISMGTTGLWVGKFETSNKSNAALNGIDSKNIIIKPNVVSWRSNTIYNFFMSAYNYEREMDSHMMKNTEWGAVAYLSHSIYGINKEININNNSSYKTGYSANPSVDNTKYPGTYGDGGSYNQAYNTEVGYLASTTGNISGIYDISGGTHEYVSSYISGNLGQSGFLNISNYANKYFDLYNTNSAITTYQYRILGDATGEMGPFSYYKDGDNTIRNHNNWYGDHSDFLESKYPWVNRGGNYDYGVLAGQFYLDKCTGGATPYLGFHLVLAA